MTFTFSVLLVESLAKPHERLCSLLSREPFKFIAKVENLDSASLSRNSAEIPEIVVVCLSAGSIPLEVVATAKRLFPAAKIVVIAERYDHDQMIDAFRMGGVAYLLRETSSAALSNALSLAATEEAVLLAGRSSETGGGARTEREVFGVKGSIPGSSAMLGSRQATSPASALSPRETTILDLVKEGDSNKHIARKLGIAEATVKCHVKAILRKINVRNRFDAAMWALRADGLQHRPIQAQPAERECSQPFMPARLARHRTPDAA